MTDSALLVWSVVWMIARILVGEVGVVPEAALPVAQVAMNRLAAGKGYDGWHAIADEPESWALDAAWEAYWQGGDKDGDIHAISEADRVALGFDEANWRNVGSLRWPVWISREWK